MLHVLAIAMDLFVRRPLPTLLIEYVRDRRAKGSSLKDRDDYRLQARILYLLLY